MTDLSSSDAERPDAAGSASAGAGSAGSVTVPSARKSPGRRSGRRPHSASRNIVEWIAVVVGAVLVALVIKTFVVQAFKIPSESMAPTLLDGDRVVVNKLSYDAHELNRGDVVVFARPPGLPAGPNDPKDLIKRVIGLPGDTLLTRDGSVYVNDRRLEEPYLPEGTMTYDIDRPLVVPDGTVFLMGDNRGHSSDSRVFGPVDADTVIGRAFMIMWPFSRIGAL
ncbi:MAG: signal peptidase I [Actinomycetota bacterium]|nr:signal peptidase I [Actinomycetota bacterium]